MPTDFGQQPTSNVARAQRELDAYLERKAARQALRRQEREARDQEYLVQLAKHTVHPPGSHVNLGVWR